jgi:hypothetical protein
LEITVSIQRVLVIRLSVAVEAQEAARQQRWRAPLVALEGVAAVMLLVVAFRTEVLDMLALLVRATLAEIVLMIIQLVVAEAVLALPVQMQL